MSREHFFLSPEAWPPPLRAAFVITFPISGPLLIVAWAIFFAGVAAAGLLFAVGLAAAWVGAVAAYPFYALWTWLEELWFSAKMDARK